VTTDQSDFFEHEIPVDDEAIAENLRMRGVNLAGDDLAVELSDTPDTVTEPTQQNLRITDGSLPIADARREQFLHCLAQGASSHAAYWQAVNGKVSRKTAQEQASRWLKRADMQARLRVLIRDFKPGQKAAVQCAGQGAEQGGHRSSIPLETKDDLIAFYEGLARTSNNEGTRMTAAAHVTKLRGLVKDPSATRNKPDPIYLGDFLRQAAANHLDPVKAAVAIHERGEDPFDGNRESDPQEATEAPKEAQEPPSGEGGAQDVVGAP